MLRTRNCVMENGYDMNRDIADALGLLPGLNAFVVKSRDDADCVALNLAAEVLKGGSSVLILTSGPAWRVRNGIAAAITGAGHGMVSMDTWEAHWEAAKAMVPLVTRHSTFVDAERFDFDARTSSALWSLGAFGAANPIVRGHAMIVAAGTRGLLLEDAPDAPEIARCLHATGVSMGVPVIAVVRRASVTPSMPPPPRVGLAAVPAWLSGCASRIYLARLYGQMDKGLSVYSLLRVSPNGDPEAVCVNLETPARNGGRLSIASELTSAATGRTPLDGGDDRPAGNVAADIPDAPSQADVEQASYDGSGNGDRAAYEEMLRRGC